MGHDIVLIMENLCAKWKVQTMFSLLWQQALPVTKRVDGTVFVVIKHTHTKKNEQIQNQMPVNKYSQILFHDKSTKL